MFRILLIAVAALFLAHTAQAETAQLFPPQGPCSADNPILAWNGSGSTYCTKFPTAALPDCKDGQFLTKKNGTLVCSDLTGQNVTAPTAPVPTAPTASNTTPTPAPTNPYNSNGTPTGIPQRIAATQGSSIPNPVVRTGNAACPNIYVPTCSSDSVLVDYGLDFNGCQTSPQCRYVGYGNAAATYAAAGYTVPAYLNTPTYTESYYSEPYIEPMYVEPYVETTPAYDEPYYGGGGDGGGEFE